ncbi:unnamed protein product, partial [marine sediment metagenome]
QRIKEENIKASNIELSELNKLEKLLDKKKK